MNRHPLRVLGVLVLLTAVVTAGVPSLLSRNSAIKVHRGDTLSQIALDHHTTVARLIALNHLPGNGLILVGQTLALPVAPTRTITRSYVVRPGDNLTHVARRLHTTPAALIARNRLHSTTILIGQHLAYGAVVRPAVRHRAAPAVRARVTRSAALHRRMLAHRAVPTRSAVRVMIVRSAHRNHIDAAMALAVAYQESGFQQRVVSPVDAIGVMQVLPSTGRALNRAYGRHFNLLKASDNVEAGVLLLRELVASTGTQAKAVAGYYQGLGSIRSVGYLPQTHVYIRNIGLLRKRFHQG